eukprot:NODE_353_length_10269_cov_0.284759.p6 type:complete len:127 gc:universal NODE_353_length_10269_cov_0.284759:8848-9228(+)
MQSNLQMILEGYRLDPCNSEILMYLGDYYEQQQLYYKAKGFYSELVELYGNALNLYKLAKITKLCGNFTEAYKLANKSYEIEKNNAIITLLIGLSKDLNLGDVQKWEDMLDKTTVREPMVLPLLNE